MVSKRRAVEAVRAGPVETKGLLLLFLEKASDEEVATWILEDTDEDETIRDNLLLRAKGGGAPAPDVARQRDHRGTCIGGFILALAGLQLLTIIVSTNCNAAVEKDMGWLLACGAELGPALLLLVLYSVGMWTRWHERRLVVFATMPVQMLGEAIVASPLGKLLPASVHSVASVLACMLAAVIAHYAMLIVVLYAVRYGRFIYRSIIWKMDG